MLTTRISVAACGAACALAAPVALATGSTAARAHVDRTPTVRVGAPLTSVAPTSTAQGFLGLATSVSTIPGLAGTSGDPDVPFDNAVRALSSGAPPVLRIGGNSADDSWWPTPGARPHDKEQYLYTLTPSWAARVRALLVRLHATALIGVNLDLSNQVQAQVSTAEVTHFDRYLGAARIDAFELGNEPEFFPLSIVTGPHGEGGHDTIAAYGKKFSEIAAQLGNVPLAGPGSVGPVWVRSLGTILRHLPARLKLATVHAYPLQNCSDLAHLSVADYFDAASIRGLAATMRGVVAAARAHGKPLRIDEMNGITCGGKEGMSNSFAEALWALNALPALWRAGVQGVNFQSVDGGFNQMIIAHRRGGGWQLAVEPVYYGLLAFAQAAPAGSRLLNVSTPALPHFYAFATRTRQGTEHVVLTNVGATARTVDVSAAGTRGTGSVSLLTAPSLNATGGVVATATSRKIGGHLVHIGGVRSTVSSGGVTLGGQHLSSSTGQLVGSARVTRIVRGAGGRYAVSVPAHTAAILTLTP